MNRFMVSRDTTRPDPTGQHVINIELFPCLLEQDILPSIFSRLSEKQLVDLDTYDFTTKITNALERFSKQLEQKACRVVKKRRLSAAREYRAILSRTLGKRCRIKSCRRCFRQEPEVGFDSLECGHDLCVKCSPLYTTIEETAGNTCLSKECPVCKGKTTIGLTQQIAP